MAPFYSQQPCLETKIQKVWRRKITSLPALSVGLIGVISKIGQSPFPPKKQPDNQSDL
jgi:hypothetical protein